MTHESPAQHTTGDDDEPQPLPDPVCEVPIQRWSAANDRPSLRRRDNEGVDHIAAEVPVAMVFNGISQAVMMATPEHLEAFALGFALSEGWLERRDELHDIDVVAGPLGVEVHLQVAASAEVRLRARRRTLAGRTGCGVCGTESLAQLHLPAARTVKAPPWLASLEPGHVLKAFAQLPARQRLTALTGGCHAAGWALPSGELLDVVEDVGRHNALDKLLGRRAFARGDFAEGFVLLSSRASHELVVKCARLGVPALATISAATSLAVSLAKQSNLRLYGFCRGDSLVRYDVGAAEGDPAALTRTG